MRLLEEKFEKIERANSPFKIPPIPRPNEKIIWLEPELIAEIKFADWTKDNLLRQASYKGLRTDKNPKEIRKEEVVEVEIQNNSIGSNSIVIQGIKITNPDKVIFDQPEITKLDIVRYYEKVSQRMLPFLSHRILSIVRCPKGVSQTCFYKKHPGPGSKGIITTSISTNSSETEEYFYIDDVTGLISEAQMGTLEFHTWGSRVENIETPDIMVFDLDPDEGMDLSMVRQGVRDLKDILDQLSLSSYLKTSGGKGYHVVVPLKPTVNWDIFYDFARRVVEVMEQKWPDRYTSNIRKTSRTGKIFIDWIRNGRGATSIAPYSLRARKGAKVSMPILWNELDTIAPDGINMWDVLKRVDEKDPWQDFFERNQTLKKI